MLCEACAALGWKTPTKIQQEALPLALEGSVRARVLRYGRRCVVMLVGAVATSVCPTRVYTHKQWHAIRINVQ